MLKNISQKIGKFFIWTLITLITLSFAVWGIGDIFRGSYDSSVAKVGSKKISQEEFNEAYRIEANRMRSYFGNNVSDEQLQQMRVNVMVLNNLINQSLLNQETENLGLKVSDEMAIKLISMNSMFQDETGNFSRQAFANFLQNNRKSEKEYLANVKEQLALSTIVDSAISVKVLPAQMLENLYLARNEQRQAGFLIVPVNSVKEIPAPSETNISEFYNRNKQSLAAPELRDITIATINIEKQKNDYKVSESDVKAEYEVRKNAFKPQVTFDIYNIITDDEAKAKEIHAAIAKGDDALKTVKEKLGLAKDDVEANGVSAESLPAEIAANLRNAREGDVLKPLKSSFGWHVIKVRARGESKFRDLAEMKKEIQAELQEKGTGDSIHKLINQLQDDIAAGTEFDAAAKKLAIPTKKYEGLVKGEVPKEFSHSPELFQAAFETEQGAESEIIQSRDGKFLYIVRVDNVKLERIRALDEVRGLIETKWKEEKRGEAAKNKAEEIVKKIKENKSASSLEQVAKTEGVQFKRSELIKKNTNYQNYPPELLDEIFTLKIGQVSQAYMDEKGNYIIASPEKIVSANAGAKSSINELQQELESKYANDIMSSYITYLRTKYPIQVNESRLAAGK